MSHNQPLLSLDQVHKIYANPTGLADHEVLTNISLSIQAGESLAIVGPSGSGKSTLLNLMGLLDKPSSGKIFYNGIDTSNLSDDTAASSRNQDIGFVFQLHHLLPQCSVLENVLLPTLPLGKENQGNYHQRAIELIQEVGLSQRMHHRPAELSGGEQLRTAVIRALINQPKILLADEPTGSLDHSTAGEISELLVALNREHHLALVVVTHSLELAAKMHTRFELKDGSLNLL